MKNQDVLKNGRGFTLVEIIASIVLLAVVLSVFMAIFPKMILWSNAAEKELVTENLLARVSQEVWDSETLKGLSQERIDGFPPCGSDFALLTKEEVNDITIPLLNEVEYKAKFEACKGGEDYQKDGLVTMHFIISNTKNERKMDSYAYFRPDGKKEGEQ